ncbi:MAG: EAL domain-containing protein [Candidatus Contendobacter sp.]
MKQRACFAPVWLDAIGCLVLLPALALWLAQSQVLQRWDALLYDWAIKNWSRTPTENIVIIAIDEHSLRELGRWPWSRRVHAELIEKLRAAGVKGIAIDIVFAEPDAADPAADAALATALAAQGRVVLPVLNEQDRRGGQLLETLPLPALAVTAAGLGHIDVDLDPDSIARSVYLRAGLGSPHWPTLALALLETLDPAVGAALPGQRAATTTPSPYAWQRDYRVLIPFAGPPGHFPHFSYSDVLRGRVPATALQDRLILVGVTAVGSGDALPTPVSGAARPMSGVEFNANVLDALQRGLLIQPLSLGYTLLLTGLLALGSSGLYAVTPSRWMPLLAVLLLTATLVGSWTVLHGAHRWFPPATALLIQALSYPLWSWRHLQQAVRALFEQEQRAQVTLDSIADAVVATDARGLVHYLNPVAERLLDRSLTALRGRPLGALFQAAAELQSKDWTDLALLCLEQRQLIQLAEPSILRNHAGREYPVRASAAPMRASRGDITGVVIAFSDLSETRRLTEQMAYQATHDALTDLPNLALLRDRLRHAIDRARHTGHALALLLISLDHIKKINEGLGRSAGDTLLRTVAARLQAGGRKEDTVARVGDDEFIYLLEDLAREERAADFARRLLQILCASITVDGHEYVITASIGVSLFPKDGEDPEVLLKNADIAVYRAKGNGVHKLQFYAHDMHTRALERLTLEQQLRHAVERGELELYYQPQMDLRQDRIVAVEALLRWRHPQRGLLSALDFVPLAEETGLIEPIGEWVLLEACQQAMAWRREAMPALRMAVNLSPLQFAQPGLVQTVIRILRDTGLEPQYLELEITESLLMTDLASGIAIMGELKAIGVKLSLDDFGSGYSSLNYLKRFPIDRLKTDRAFLREIPASPADTAITLAIIAMAHSLGLTVLAEGVENQEQLAFLRVHQCDEIQGHYLSCAIPPQAIPALINRTLL